MRRLRAVVGADPKGRGKILLQIGTAAFLRLDDETLLLPEVRVDIVDVIAIAILVGISVQGRVHLRILHTDDDAMIELLISSLIQWLSISVD